MLFGFHFALLLFSAPLWAQTQTWVFQSPSDRFELLLRDSEGTVNKLPADLTHLKNLLPALTQPLKGECPKIKGSPDATVSHGGRALSVYVSEGLIQESTGCLKVSGDGIFYFPIHRDFLIGPDHESLDLKNQILVSRAGKKIFELKRGREGWINPNPESLLNWNFISRFENSLADFKVRARVHPALAKNKPKIMIQSKRQRFEFTKISPSTWALKKPGGIYLIISDDWSFWENFDREVLEDSYAAQIRKLKGQKLSADEKKQLLEQISATWSPNTRELYHHLLLSDGDPEIQTLVLRRLRQRPSEESVAAIMSFLMKTRAEDLKREAVGILKIQNPRGPKYDPSTPADERRKVMDYWRDWWAKNPKLN